MEYDYITISDMINRISTEEHIQVLRRQYDYSMQVLQIVRDEHEKMFNNIINRIQKESEEGISDTDRLTFIGLRTEALEQLDANKRKIKDEYIKSLKSLEESL